MIQKMSAAHFYVESPLNSFGEGIKNNLNE
jgi:hypothetical protein